MSEVLGPFLAVGGCCGKTRLSEIGTAGLAAIVFLVVALLVVSVLLIIRASKGRSGEHGKAPERREDGAGKEPRPEGIDGYRP